MQTKLSSQQRGFALLLTIIVVSIVLAIGLSLLNITVKQFTLSATARDSEEAFHTANSGVECMQYHRSVDSTYADLVNGGSAPSLPCGGYSQVYSNADHDTLSGNRYIYNYIYQYDLNGNACIETSMYLLDTRSSASAINNYTVNEGLETLSCGAGVVCTAIFSRGFNRGCSQLDSIRTVQREITIEF